MILVLAAAVLLQGGAAEVSGPDREFLAQCRRVGERFRDAVNNRDPAAFRETFSQAVKDVADLDAVASKLDEFRLLRGKVLLVKQSMRLSDGVVVRLVTERSASGLRFDLDSEGKINGFGYAEEAPPKPTPPLIYPPLGLPVRGEWVVTAGGSSLEGNHHMAESEMGLYAVDLSMYKEGRDGLEFHKEDGTRNEDYFTFGQEVVAAAPGRVVIAVDGVPDNEPGIRCPLYPGGNHVLIKHGENFFTQYVHLKQGSVKVRVGSGVAQGQPIAQSGSSGTAPAPHLHFGMINSENLGSAVGQRIIFRDVVVKRDGREFEAERYEPQQGDLIRPRAGPPANAVAVQQPREVVSSRLLAPKVAPPASPDTSNHILDVRLVSRRFVESVNQGGGRLFYELFSDAFKQDLKLDALDSFLKEFVESRGKIVRSRYVQLIGNATQFRYTGEAEGAFVTFYLDPDGSVGGFQTRDLPTAPVPVGNAVPLTLPVQGRWAVRWGGADPRGNPHMSQDEIERYAVDLAVPEDEAVHFHENLTNEDFAAFGRDVLAAAPGEVVMAVDGNQDNPPGHADPTTTIGNAILVKHAENEFALYGHLQRGSVAVKVGDRVRAGQVVARCGNSGASMRPHLQFGLINDADPSFATGFSFTFRDVVLTRDGRDEARDVYEPRAGDLIRKR